MPAHLDSDRVRKKVPNEATESNRIASKHGIRINAYRLLCIEYQSNESNRRGRAKIFSHRDFSIDVKIIILCTCSCCVRDRESKVTITYNRFFLYFRVNCFGNFFVIRKVTK